MVALGTEIMSTMNDYLSSSCSISIKHGNLDSLLSHREISHEQHHINLLENAAGRTGPAIHAHLGI